MYTSCVHRHNDIKTKRTSINRKEEEKISSNHTTNLTAKTSTYPEQPHCIEGQLFLSCQGSTYGKAKEIKSCLSSNPLKIVLITS